MKIKVHRNGVSTHSRPKAAGMSTTTVRGFLILFQLTAARRRLARAPNHPHHAQTCFNSQPPEGGWQSKLNLWRSAWQFQLTAARRRLVWRHGRRRSRQGRFNSQPPEGGWRRRGNPTKPSRRFNSQPPEGGWIRQPVTDYEQAVSTHSRPKAAGAMYRPNRDAGQVSTHSRPKAAGF